jgi:hypothetical protein
MIEDIRAAKRTSDTVLVCMHWGQEHVHYPIPSQRRLAREMIAAGANLIVGHHPHVLQGVEAVDRGLVAYSLGNFTFAEEEWNGLDPKGNQFRMQSRLSEPARRTAVLRLAVDGATGSVRHEVIPAYLGADLRVTPDPRPDRVKDFRRYSARLRKPG